MDFQIPFNNLLAKIIAKANNKAKNKWNKTDEFPAKIKRRIMLRKNKINHLRKAMAVLQLSETLLPEVYRV